MSYTERLATLEAAVRELTEEIQAMKVRPPGVFTKGEREWAAHVYEQGIRLVQELRPEIGQAEAALIWERYFPTAMFA
jgi:hypothetical protein